MSIVIVVVGGAWLYWLLAPVVCGNAKPVTRVEPTWSDDDE